MSASAIPKWLHDLHTHDHLTEVILILAKRERARDAARARSRRRAASSMTGRIGGTLKDALAGAVASGDKIDHYGVIVGSLPENKKANRYLQLEPYDRTRVVVGEGAAGQLKQGQEGGSEGRYINANWVREFAGGKWWVATQAPLPVTVHAFLSIILQTISRPPRELHPHQYSSETTRVRTVVQLTPNVEQGMQKAHLYFPSEIGGSWQTTPEPGHSAPDIEVKLLANVTHEEARCVQSTISISPVGQASSEPIIFQHLLYGAWPDHGVPSIEDRASILEFARLVDRINRDTSLSSSPHRLDPDPPIMVGCSAGIGRTGSFIALCSLLRKHGFLPPPTPGSSAVVDEPHPALVPSPLGELPKELADDPIAVEIDALREQRPGMVQREDQIVLIYEVLALAFAQGEQ